MNRRQGLIGGLGLGVSPWLPARGADAPLIEQTRLIDSFSVTGRDLAPGQTGQTGRAGATFLPRRDGGPVWLLFDIVARREPQGSGDLVFDNPLLNVSVPAAQSKVLVKERHMVKPRPEAWPRDAEGRLTTASGRRLGDEAQAALAAALTAGQARRLVVIHRIDLGHPQETQPRVAVARQSGLQPLLVELQVGQGPVPRELQAFADGVNGPWLLRHVNETAMIGSGVLLGALAIWRLRR